MGVFNAKAQGREGAKGFSVFAFLRLGDFVLKALIREIREIRGKKLSQYGAIPQD